MFVFALQVQVRLVVRRRRHTVSAVRPDVFLRVILALDYPGIGVMGRARVLMRTLTERVGVYLVDHLLSFAHGEQPAGFFTLAPDPLYKKK